MRQLELVAEPETGAPTGSWGVGSRVVTPRHRLPLGLRVVAALIGVSALLATAALMISDRAPGVLRRLFGDLARQLSERIDADGRAAQVSIEGRLPEPDFVVHVALWLGVTVLVGIAVWTWRGLIIGAAAVFASSVAIELAQSRYSDTRSVERSDLFANALGVAIGACAVGVLYLIGSAMASVFADRRD